MELLEYMAIIKDASDGELKSLSIVDNWPITTDLDLEHLSSLFKVANRFSLRIERNNYISFGYVPGTVIVDLKKSPESFPVYSKNDPDEKKRHHERIMKDFVSTAKLHPYLNPKSINYPGKAMEGVSKSKAMVYAIEDIVDIFKREGVSFCFPRSYEGFGDDYSKVVYHYARSIEMH